MDNNIPDWKGQTALATTNNLEAGKLAGGYLKTVLKDGDTLGILEGVPGVPALDDRVNGMLEGLKGVDVKIVGKGATDCTEEKGINVAQDILTANPGREGDLLGLRSAGRRRRAGDQERQARPTRSSWSASTSAAARRKPWRPGSEDASVAQFPAKMAELGVDALVKAIHGEKVESLIDSGAALVTKDNMDKFK